MPKLSGWKRIAIVASVVWVLGAGYHTLSADEEADVQIASQMTLSCEADSQWKRSPECDKISTDYLKGMYSVEWEDAAFVAFAPVPWDGDSLI